MNTTYVIVAIISAVFGSIFTLFIQHVAIPAHNRRQDRLQREKEESERQAEEARREEKIFAENQHKFMKMIYGDSVDLRDFKIDLCDYQTIHGPSRLPEVLNWIVFSKENLLRASGEHYVRMAKKQSYTIKLSIFNSSLALALHDDFQGEIIIFTVNEFLTESQSKKLKLQPELLDKMIDYNS